jgi:hypothetical protein
VWVDVSSLETGTQLVLEILQFGASVGGYFIRLRQKFKRILQPGAGFCADVQLDVLVPSSHFTNPLTGLICRSIFAGGSFGACTGVPGCVQVGP